MSLAAALLALAIPAQEAPAAEPAMLIVEFEDDAKFVGFPRHCPGATAEEDADPQTICTAALFEGRIHVVRRISGPKASRGGRLRYTAHAYAVRAGTRMLILAYRVKDPPVLFAPWWKWGDDRGEVCLSAEDAKELGVETQWQRWRARVARVEGVRYPQRCIAVST